MIYKELCPTTLHFPYSAAQDGLQLLAVSRQARSEFLPTIRTVSSIVLHLNDAKIVDQFSEWFQLDKNGGFVHLTEISITASFNYQTQVNARVYCKLQITLFIDKLTNDIDFLYDEPANEDQVWVYRGLTAKQSPLQGAERQCNVGRALRKSTKGAAGIRPASTLISKKSKRSW